MPESEARGFIEVTDPKTGDTVQFPKEKIVKFPSIPAPESTLSAGNSGMHNQFEKELSTVEVQKNNTVTRAVVDGVSGRVKPKKNAD